MCIINSSRAALIDKVSLIDALKNRLIAGVALDGFWQEPPENDDPIFSFPNSIITPHVGWGSHETRQLLLEKIGQRISDFTQGREIYVC
jgi:glycerate dehydrogenase